MLIKFAAISAISVPFVKYTQKISMIIRFMVDWVCLETVTSCHYHNMVKWCHHCTSKCLQCKCIIMQVCKTLGIFDSRKKNKTNWTEDIFFWEFIDDVVSLIFLLCYDGMCECPNETLSWGIKGYWASNANYVLCSLSQNYHHLYFKKWYFTLVNCPRKSKIKNGIKI